MIVVAGARSFSIAGDILLAFRRKGREVQCVRALCLLALLCACKEDASVGPDFGGRCTSREDCTFRCLASPATPGGLCTRNCTRDADCALGAACLAMDDGPACVYICFADKDCTFLDSEVGTGWGCRTRDRGDAGVGLFCLGP
jgi:hypothetical protein